MLAFVLGVVLFVGIIGMALMMMTVTATRVSYNLSLPLKAYRDIDRAMEETVQAVRAESSACTDVNPPSYDVAGIDLRVEVRCETVSNVSGSRVHRFEVAEFAGTPGANFGRAQVRVTDTTHGSQVFGLSMVVCDWVLGGSDVNDLQACPT